MAKARADACASREELKRERYNIIWFLCQESKSLLMKKRLFKFQYFAWAILIVLSLFFSSCKKETTTVMVHSDWLTVQLLSGIYASTYYTSINAPELTQEILDKGVINMYVKDAGSTWQIPNASFDGLYVKFSVGKIEIFAPQPWDTNSGYKYRYVLIPGA